MAVLPVTAIPVMAVYTVRIYSGTLTRAEKEYNHLIDLLGFYQVAIPANMAASSLMTVAPTYMSTAFVYDETAFGANQAALEEAVADATF